MLHDRLHAALGRFIVEFNEIEYLVSVLIWEIAPETAPEERPSAILGRPLSARLALLRALLPTRAPELADAGFRQTLEAAEKLSILRNRYAHARWDVDSDVTVQVLSANDARIATFTVDPSTLDEMAAIARAVSVRMWAVLVEWRLTRRDDAETARIRDEFPQWRKRIESVVADADREADDLRSFSAR